jgi:4-amino-4-deoxy-L-arabinose transferase-like glycosyltransferase
MYLGAICAAGALLTKQPGGIALIFGVAAACRFGVLSKLTGVVKQRVCIFSAALFLILAGPWYLYFFWMAHLGHDASNLVYLTTRIHGNRSFLDRLMHAITGPIFDVLSTLGPPHYVGGVCGVLMLLGLLAPSRAHTAFRFCIALRRALGIIILVRHSQPSFGSSGIELGFWHWVELWRLNVSRICLFFLVFTRLLDILQS